MATSLLYQRESEGLLNEPYGCQHYKRKVKLVTPCCNKVYTCRFCHDDKETHPLNRKEVVEVVCAICDLRQYVQNECKNCGVEFGKYSCLACKLFDDEPKDQFHCAKCAICRVGGRAKFYHCKKCDMCINLLLECNHKCVENGSHSDCPVCIEDLHASVATVHLSSCGHYLHEKCFEELKEAGRSACPVCLQNFD